MFRCRDPLIVTGHVHFKHSKWWKKLFIQNILTFPLSLLLTELHPAVFLFLNSEIHYYRGKTLVNKTEVKKWVLLLAAINTYFVSVLLHVMSQPLHYHSILLDSHWDRGRCCLTRIFYKYICMYRGHQTTAMFCGYNKCLNHQTDINWVCKYALMKYVDFYHTDKRRSRNEQSK